MIIIMLISFAVFIILDIPIAFSIGMSTLVGLLFQNDIPLIVIPYRMFAGLDKYLFLAMPFFILTGVAMDELNLTDKVVKIANVLVGHKKGGLAQVNIVASIIFGGIQGSGTADTAAIGSILIPSMIKEGYSKGYSAAVTAASSCLAPIIPPSMMMVIYGAIAEVSIGELFLGGYIPGLIAGVLLMIVAHIYAIRGAQAGIKRKSSFTFRDFGSSIVKGGPVFLIAIIIVGGILGGIFTPTESGAIAAGYTLLISTFYYKTLTWKGLSRIFVKGGLITAMCGIILSTASVFNWILTSAEIPAKLLSYLLKIGLSNFAVTLFIIIGVYFIGFFMDVLTAMIVLVPLLAPIGLQLGYDPVNWGVLMVILFNMGAITPPIGIGLVLSTSIAKCEYLETCRAVIPFVLILIICVFLVAFIPPLTTFLPRLLR